MKILVHNRNILGEPQNFLAECVVIWDPNNHYFLAFLRNNFRKFEVCVVLFDTIFFRKNLRKIRYSFGFFLKNQCFTLQNGLKWKDLKNFDIVTYKTPHRPFLENFENLTVKTSQNSLILHF